VVIFAEAMSQFKGYLGTTPLSQAAQGMVLRFVVAFSLHAGRMSCLSAAGAVRSEACHRAQTVRFLAQPRWQRRDINLGLRQDLLEREQGGLFVFIVDATLVSQSGKQVPNTHSTGNRKRRPRKGRRYNQKKQTPKTCHSFTMGLLITPSGVRIPYAVPYYTKAYCQLRGRVHRTTAETAAQMILDLPIVADGKTQVVVLGDTAYEADVVRKACQKKHYAWIFPSNSERVFAGPKGQRPKVRSALQNWSSWPLVNIQVSPAQGPLASYRRLSASRRRPKQKPKAYLAHEETRKVHSLGEVRLVYSTTPGHRRDATPDDTKILVTNLTAQSLKDILELYSLRWQIELFFKELKSGLGFDQYQFSDFACVEGWLTLTLTTFLSLERMRAEQLARQDLSGSAKAWWRCQRTHGLCQALKCLTEQQQLKCLAEHLETPEGLAKLRQILKTSYAPEYQAKF
jgi:hypothetical protein